MKLPIVVPCYNEAEVLRIFYDEINKVSKQMNEYDFQFVFVDDGSKDETLAIMKDLGSGDDRVTYIALSRNFGKEAAMFAGMYYSKGDCCVIIDCDLQHPPEKIVEMYHLWEEGYAVIEAVKKDRGKEGRFRSFAAKCFYDIISRITDIDMSRASDFKLMDRKAVTVLLNMREKNAFFRALSSWIGFKTTKIEFNVQERTVGESKWSTVELIRYAISNVSAFSTAPMQIVTFLGILMLSASVILGCGALYDKMAGIAPEGFTTVIIIELFIGSVIMISLGIIGYYISKIYEEVKDRPRYIVSDILGDISE